MSEASAEHRIAALNAAALKALAARDLRGAQTLLMEAIGLGADEVGVWLNLAGARRALNDPAGALEAAQAALRLDPRAFFGLLIKGAALEALGREREAASVFGMASSQAPPEAAMSDSTRQAMAHGRALNQRYATRLQAFVRADLAELRAGVGEREAGRVEAFVDIAVGAARRVRQEPVSFFFPEMPAIEFYDRAIFPWLGTLEAAAPAMIKELAGVIFEDFTPYVNYDEGIPLDQWAELNKSPRWSVFHLLQDGRPVAENCARCPQTMAALAPVPQPRVEGNSPSAMFSSLRPHTRIPPHTGVANTRLVLHLPLVVPPGCGFRVGNTTREWRVGEAWIFDDTIEHEAWNDSDRDRIILIVDIWSPFLSEVERAMVARAIAAMDRFNRGDA